MKENLKANNIVVAMSDPSKKYFRHEVYPLYKAHRTSGEKPLVLNALLKEVFDNTDYASYMRPGLEADDILGIFGTREEYAISLGERIIVTADKDLYQIPGLHYNPRKPEQGVFTQTPEAADHFFYQQCLSGDPTDGVPGCPRIGPVKAKQILAEAYERAEDPVLDLETEVWTAIVAAYAAKGKDEAYALSQARCVRILRASDYDFINKRPILWTPN